MKTYLQGLEDALCEAVKEQKAVLRSSKIQHKTPRVLSIQDVMSRISNLILSERQKQDSNTVPFDTALALGQYRCKITNPIYINEKVDVSEIKNMYKHKFGTHKKHCRWELTIDWLCMSNDDFFDLYGFYCVPTSKLVDLAWETRAKLINDKTEKPMTLQINSATNLIFNQLSNPLRLVKNYE